MAGAPPHLSALWWPTPSACWSSPTTSMRGCSCHASLRRVMWIWPGFPTTPPRKADYLRVLLPKSLGMKMEKKLHWFIRQECALHPEENSLPKTGQPTRERRLACTPSPRLGPISFPSTLPGFTPYPRALPALSQALLPPPTHPEDTAICREQVQGSCRLRPGSSFETNPRLCVHAPVLCVTRLAGK